MRVEEHRTVVLAGVAIVDVTAGTVNHDMSLVLRNNRIERMGPSPNLEPPEDALVVEARGNYVLPGLIDMHVHYRDWVPELFINHGVTSVRDTGNQLTWIMAQKRAEETGLLDIDGVDWYSRAGPRIFVSAVMNTRPRGRGHHYAAPDIDDARRVVGLMASLGVDGFKLHDGTSLEMLRAVCKEAHGHGLKVTAHPSEQATVKGGVEGGLDGVEHSLQFTEVPEGESMELIEKMLKRRVDWCPTITLDEAMIFDKPPGWGDVVGMSPEDAQYARDLVSRQELSYLPKKWIDIQLAAYPKGGKAPSTDPVRNSKFERFKTLIREFIDGGGKLLCGTDATFVSMAGFVMHEELTAMVEAVGLSPLEALQAATVNAADHLGKPDIGRVSVGARADLVLLDGNPLDNIRNTRRINAVFKDGKQVKLEYHSDFVQLMPRPLLPGSPDYAEFMLQSSQP